MNIEICSKEKILRSMWHYKSIELKQVILPELFWKLSQICVVPK